jgi:small subunit ribosomal protein S17
VADEERTEKTLEETEAQAPEEPAAEAEAPPEPAAEAPAEEEPPVEEAAAEAPAAEAEPPTEEAAAEEPPAEEPAAEEPPAEEPAAEAPAAEAEAPAEEPARRAKPKRKPRPERRQRPKRRREQVEGRRPIVRLPKPEHERGRRQERRGVVVSSAMDKTIVVQVETVKAHARYKKVIRRSRKFHAHDEQNAAKVGDVVRIVETRPMSKTKNWRLAEVVEEAK